MITQKKSILSTLRILPAAAAMTVAAALAGCVHTDDPPVPTPDAPTSNLTPGEKQRPVSVFPISRSGSSSDPTGTPLQDICTDFGVYTRKTPAAGDAQNVMILTDGSPYQVQWTNPGWNYSLPDIGQYMRYWDLSASSYHFQAFAPFTGAAAAADISLNAQGRLIISGITGNVARTATNAIDWLVASYTRTNGASPTDADLLAGSEDQPSPPTDFTSVVPLKFHHLMPLVEMRAYTNDENPLVVTDFKVTFVTYNEDDDEYNDSPQIATLGTYTSRTTPGNIAIADVTADTSTENHTPLLTDVTGAYIQVKPLADPDKRYQGSSALCDPILELPQTMAGTKILATVTTLTGLTSRAVFTLPEDWRPDARYIYYFVISDRDEVILFDVDVEKYNWQEGNDIDLSETPLDNW